MVDNALRTEIRDYKRENVELTEHCGAFLDSCAKSMDDSDGNPLNLVVGRSEISRLGLKKFSSISPLDGPANAASSAICVYIMQNYKLLHESKNEVGRALIYDREHFKAIRMLGIYHVMDRPAIYVRRCAIALGLAAQDFVNPAHVAIDSNLRDFLLKLRNMLT